MCGADRKKLIQQSQVGFPSLPPRGLIRTHTAHTHKVWSREWIKPKLGNECTRFFLIIIVNLCICINILWTGSYYFQMNSACWVILHDLFSVSSADFLQNLLFRKNLSGTLSVLQTVWIQIRIHVLLVLIWVQTVCKDFQQTSKVTASR